ncbi:type III secretion system translocon subunit SctE [Microbulbifer sp. EKSA005]|uniref:type III secretion system translocon subunit SctE n=1 Tax=Microbulbifer sp. EKSA005 TaxID=3243364 RepID=UPI00404245ED
MIVNSIQQKVLTNDSHSAGVQDLSQQSLEIAQREKFKMEMGSLVPVARSTIGGNAQRVELDVPEVGQNEGNFYGTLTGALARLAGLMGDMADTIQFELQFKRQEIKKILEDKLRDIQENAELEQERKKNEEELAKQKKIQKICGAVCNFFMGAAEMVAGACMVVAGAVSLNPAMIAGGVCLAAAGAVEVAEGAVRLANGSEEMISRLSNASTGLLVAGVAFVTFGAAAPAAGAMVGAKKGVKKGVEEGVESVVEKGVKEGAEKGAKEITEKASKEGAEKGAEEVAEDVAKDTTKEASQKIAKKFVDRGIKTAATSGSVAVAGNGAKEIYTSIKQNDYDKREAELDNEIKALQARLEAVEAKQEFINKLVQLLQEQWTRAIISPVQDAVKVLNNAIQDRAGVNMRISASHGV